MGIGRINRKKHSRIFSNILGVTLVLFLVVFLQPAFAERQFSFEKVVDINKNTLQNSLTDLDSLQKIFPQNVKSVESKFETEEKSYAKMTIGLGGFSINSDIELTNHPDSKHTIEIISGDLRGTKLITALTETWGFDGVPNQGTVVEIDMTLHTSGYLSLIGLAPDDAIIYSLDRSLLDIVSYAKSYEDKKEFDENDEEIFHNSDEHETKSNVSKRKFKR